MATYKITTIEGVECFKNKEEAILYAENAKEQGTLISVEGCCGKDNLPKFREVLPTMEEINKRYTIG